MKNSCRQNITRVHEKKPLKLKIAVKTCMTYHECVVERSEDMCDGKIIITIGIHLAEGCDLFDGLFLLCGSFSLLFIVL